MAPKTLNTIVPLLVVLSLFLFQLSFAIQPVIHITSLIGGVKVETKARGDLVSSARLTPGKDVQIRVTINDVYFADSEYSFRPFSRPFFATVKAYNPARDKGRAAVYWKVDDWGWSISYDNRTFKQVEQWESE